MATSTRSGLAPKTRLATQIYLRPASCAWITACSRLEVSRTEASLISIGRLTAAMTSILEPFIIEIARLEGVPPNISVSTTTPAPLSTLVTAETISWRRCSISSSGPMAIDSICFCGTGHMFQSGAKFRREAAMGHEDDSNHRTYLFVGELRACTHTKTGDIGASRVGQCRFCSHQDVPLYFYGVSANS